VVVIGAAIAVWITATITRQVLVDRMTTTMKERIPRQRVNSMEMVLVAVVTATVAAGQKYDPAALLRKLCSAKI
jgi:hypothetical protein